MNITNTIVRLAAPYPAVAFDVFDTLIKRDVAKPTDVFLLQGTDFARARVCAEQAARAQNTGEITLPQIYAQPGMEKFDPAEECAWENKVVVPYTPVQEAVRLLRAQGKRVYYISDMYLPPEQIAAMLDRCGYPPFDGGFVSSAYGVQKRSGALFRRFLRETGFKCGDVLFVGDSWRADVTGAALAGIRSWHLPTEPPPETAFPDSAVQAFTANHEAFVSGWGDRLGFTLLGALEVAFCQWIHARREEHPEAGLFFLARDMYLTREIYHRMYPQEETKYLEVSRRSLCPCLLAKNEKELVAAALPRQRLTGQQIADYCGASCPEAYRQKTYMLKTKEGQEALPALLDALQPPREATLALAYLRQSGLRAGDILVDIGSGGTTQFLLQKLLGVSLYGLQLSGDARLRERFSEEETSVFLSLQGADACLYWVGQPMLERMISQDVGATVGYRQLGQTVCVCQQPQNREKRIDELQRGALRFAEEWQNSALSGIRISAVAAIMPFLRMVRCPRKSQVAFLGRIQVEDGGTYTLADPKKLRHYIFHPVEMKRDLAESRWKIGFLQKLLPGPLPYGRLYLGMKKQKER